MEYYISATELARRLGDVLGRVRYRGETFVIERNGRAVARLGPVADSAPGSARQALTAWASASDPDPDLAHLLEEVGKTDRPPKNPWAWSSTRARSSR